MHIEPSLTLSKLPNQEQEDLLPTISDGTTTVFSIIDITDGYKVFIKFDPGKKNETQCSSASKELTDTMMSIKPTKPLMGDG
jgi:hypothetical protein